MVSDAVDSFIVTFKGREYDITEFLAVHPGGCRILSHYRNKDITMIMRDPRASHVHSEAAFKILEKFLLTKDKLDSFQSGILDMSKPLVSQVLFSNISKKDYLKSIHDPLCVRGSPRLFAYDALEALTKTPWFVIPLLWIPVALVFLFYGSFGMNVTSLFIHFVFGIFLWSFLEYCIHRFIFHSDSYLPDHPFALTIHFLLHGIHHVLPVDPLRLVFPPALLLIVSIPVIAILTLLVSDVSLRCVYMSGILIGYVGYDLTHYFLHHMTVKKWSGLKFMRSYHWTHHFSPIDKNYGVTTPLWDVVFSTD